MAKRKEVVGFPTINIAKEYNKLLTIYMGTPLITTHLEKSLTGYIVVLDKAKKQQDKRLKSFADKYNVHVRGNYSFAVVATFTKD